LPRAIAAGKVAAMQRVKDDLGRDVCLLRAPRRVVSLVPSDTYTLCALGCAERVVGRTSYCDVPAVAAAEVVGGTKDVDVDAVLALAPELVIANQEENTRGALERLAERVPVLVSMPRRVGDAVAHVARLARLLEVQRAPEVVALIRAGYALGAAPPPPPRRRAFAPIWMDPLMTMNADTFGADVLAAVGIGNAFDDRLRLYPLAADLGKAAAADPAGRDQRYPRVSFAEVAARQPDLVVLADEPHAFGADDRAALAAALPGVAQVDVSGRDLFWYGAWTIEALPRLRATAAAW
jgi:ABC-type Fe3+-hydroxamate transport system substrate-binding protein